MKCNICGKREATVHLTEVVNENVTKLHLCEECAKSKTNEMQEHFGLADLLSGLVDFGPEISEGPFQKDTGTKCSSCGMTYHDFQNVGRLGCGKCYETFSENLSVLLRKIHGSDRHMGKTPLGGVKKLEPQENIQSLKDELKDLVKREEFEKAALVRDRIKETEKKQKEKNETG